MAVPVRFKVVSRIPVSVNHGNGSVIAYPRGTVFDADPALADIRRLLQSVPARIARTSVAEKVVPVPGPSLPLPAERPPVKNVNLPNGIHDLVRGPGL